MNYPISNINLNNFGNNDSNSTIVSVVIPAFNCQRDLDRIINALVNSSLAEIEVIVVDDFSEKPIVIKVKDSRIKLIRNNANLGKATSVNNGLKIAIGKYYVISDPDVEPHFDLLKRWVAVFEENHRIGVCGAYVCYPNSNKLTHAGAILSGPLRQPKRRLVNRQYEDFSSKTVVNSKLVFDDIWAVRASVWWQVGGFDDVNFDTMYEDVDIQYRISKQGYLICLVSGAKAYHHQHFDETGDILAKSWAHRVLFSYKLSKLTKNHLVFLKKTGSGKFILGLDALALLIFYGILILHVSVSVHQKMSTLYTLLSSVRQGLRHRI